MRRFAAVALREVAERRSVLVAAAAAAVLPFLVPLLPSVPASDAGTARAVTALVLACAFGVGGAVLVGASVVGRELAEKRLSFHFARPLPAPVIWGGKLVGGLALVLLAEAIVYLPASLASGRFPGLIDRFDASAIAALLLLAVPLFLLAWVGSVAVRSRSPWLVVDFVLLAASAAAVFLLGRKLARFEAVPGPEAILTMVGVLLAALLVATLVQVAAGRTDLRRGHGAQSLALWAVLMAGLAAGAAWVERVVDPGVARLEGAVAEPAGPGGTWVVVEGGTPGSWRGSARYLLDLASGRSVRLRPGWSTTVSADGTRAAHVTTVRPRGKEVELETIDLRDGESASFPLPEWADGIDLTPDGRRLAVVAGGLCRVVELPSLRLLASARVPSESWNHVPRFVSPDVVRIFPHRHRLAEETDAELVPQPELLELDVVRRMIAVRARYELPPRSAERDAAGSSTSRRHYFLEPSPDLSRVLLTALGAGRGIRLLETGTGRVLAGLDGPSGPGRPRGAFLADGRVVLAEPGPTGFRLDLLSRDGVRITSIPLPGKSHGIRFGSEPAAGLLHVAVAFDVNSLNWGWHLVDLGTGRATPLHGERPQRSWWSDTSRYPPAGSPATQLVRDVRGRLVLVDPKTAARKPLTREDPRHVRLVP